MAWASCGREKLALLQLPVLVKYRIALVLVPLASDSRILSPRPVSYDQSLVHHCSTSEVIKIRIEGKYFSARTEFRALSRDNRE
jgi:hypothetical protein